MKVSKIEMGFWQAHDSVWSKMLKVSKLVFELSSAQNELKRGGTGKRWLDRGSMAAHEVPEHELDRELSRSCSRLHSHGSTQPRAFEGETELSEERRSEEVA